MEASNAKGFLRAMESRGLTALTAPQVVDEVNCIASIKSCFIASIKSCF